MATEDLSSVETSLSNLSVQDAQDDSSSSHYSTTPIATKPPLTLLDLPLVLVHDILEHFVRDSVYIIASTWPPERLTNMWQLVSVREVNSTLCPHPRTHEHYFNEAAELFYSEITHLLGRIFGNWDGRDRTRCMYTASRPLFIQLLQSCVGEYDRGGSAFVTRMHDAVDVLMGHLEVVGMPKERHDVVYDVCRALSMRLRQKDLSEDHASKQWDPSPTALIVAMVAGHDHVVDLMLESLPSATLRAEAWDFGTPLEMAMTLGYTTQMERLLDHGVELNLRSQHADFYGEELNPRSQRWALEFAAQRGHADAIERAFRDVRDPPRGYLDLNTMRTLGSVMEYAAANQQWHTVAGLLHRDVKFTSSDTPPENVLCYAAKYGQEDLARELIELHENHEEDGVHHMRFPTHRFPLRDAASGGHLAICKLLFEKGVRPQGVDLAPLAQVLARAVARGGSIEVCQFLKQRKLWTPALEIHFLPIAAEYGHLEFAKFAIENGCDRHPKQRPRAPHVVMERKKRLRYPDDIRYFALCRAIVSGHLHIVRWLIDEVGLNVSKLAFPPLLPMDLAMAADNEDMIKLLLDLGLSSVSGKTAELNREAEETLVLYRDALCLQDDYAWNWFRRSPWDKSE